MSTPKSRVPRRAAGLSQRGRRPHNAKQEEFGSIAELVCKLAAEMKPVTINGKVVEISWAERSMRLMIDRALAGNRRDLAQLLRLMIEHPSISGSYRERQVTFIRGPLANV